MRNHHVVAGIGQRDLIDVGSVRDTRLAQIRRFIKRVVVHLAHNSLLGREVQKALALKLVATAFFYPRLVSLWRSRLPHCGQCASQRGGFPTLKNMPE
jgi:hypothetical protein